MKKPGSITDIKLTNNHMNNHFFITDTTGTTSLRRIILMLIVFYSLHAEAQDLSREDVGLNRLSGTFMKAQVRGPEHKLLDQLIGRWINEGQVISSPDSTPMKIVTSDIYEWAPGGLFVIHYAYGHAGNEYGGAVEIIGYDPEGKTYKNYCFDSNGILTQEEMKIGKNVLSAQGKYTRCNGAFSNNGKTLKVLHERSDDGGKTWQPAMDVTLVRID